MTRVLTGIVAFVLLAGCAGIPEGVSRVETSALPPELGDTPFYPQERYQCGPAALATVLDASGVDVDVDALVSQVYVPERRGSFQVELLAATRRAGRIPYRIDGNLASVAAELASGRPVLVLQNLGLSWYPRWHYAVVIGIDTKAESVVLRSGTERRRVTATTTFLRTWRRGDYWAFVALEPGDMPAMADPERYMRAVTDFENRAGREPALPAWQAATRAWPDSGPAWFGLANLELAMNRYPEAEAAYRRAVEADAGLWVARNNLAFALHFQGRDDEAIAVLQSALAAVTDDRAREEIRDSLLELQGQ